MNFIFHSNWSINIRSWGSHHLRAVHFIQYAAQATQERSNRNSLENNLLWAIIWNLRKINVCNKKSWLWPDGFHCLTSRNTQLNHMLAWAHTYTHTHTMIPHQIHTYKIKLLFCHNYYLCEFYLFSMLIIHNIIFDCRFFFCYVWEYVLVYLHELVCVFSVVFYVFGHNNLRTRSRASRRK